MYVTANVGPTTAAGQTTKGGSSECVPVWYVVGSLIRKTKLVC